jgi:hypothetical protein
MSRHNFTPVEVLVYCLTSKRSAHTRGVLLDSSHRFGWCQVGLIAGFLRPSIAVTGTIDLLQAFTQNGRLIRRGTSVCVNLASRQVDLTAYTVG